MKPFESLGQLKAGFSEAGAYRLLAKVLAANDNSKQQVYLGGSWDAVRVLPVSTVTAAGSGATKHFSANLRLCWMDGTGHEREAPHAKLILYPQYPEVRFSGFLRGVADAPISDMTSRRPGRVLFFGIKRDGTVLTYVAPFDSRVAREAAATLCAPVGSSSLIELNLSQKSSSAHERRLLLQSLRRVYERGWIDSKQLGGDGVVRSCEAQNCGGLTLEAELGIAKNSRSEADYAGWEVKQFATTESRGMGSGRVTLMTPEPNGGLYESKGAEAFVRRYGYRDLRGRHNRINFGGNFVVGKKALRTRLTLALDGFDLTANRITDPGGRVLLVAANDEVAASWSFAGLMAHWARKHQRAAYVPSRRRLSPRRQYRFGPVAHLGEGTDFQMFLVAMASGSVVYDPGMKLVLQSGRWSLKRRSQFRVAVSRLPTLYTGFETTGLLGHA
jgi:hypothetical protein